MSAVYLDTHVAVFLCGGLIEELSAEAKRYIEGNDLLVSPIVLLELDYLFRRKRIAAGPDAALGILTASFGVAVCPFPFTAVVRESIGLEWTDDPFDRLIVGHARANHGAALVTRDRLIRRHYAGAVW